jgi:flavorubredoxin
MSQFWTAKEIKYCYSDHVELNHLLYISAWPTCKISIELNLKQALHEYFLEHDEMILKD